jgi:transcriptional regulator with XRE-family HTH domain
MSFGNRLYELRKSRNISQEELAELLDVSRQSISKWENDKAYPEMTRLLYMSDYFGVSLDYLMRGVEKDEHHEEASTAFQSKKYADGLEHLSVQSVRQTAKNDAGAVWSAGLRACAGGLQFALRNGLYYRKIHRQCAEITCAT